MPMLLVGKHISEATVTNIIVVAQSVEGNVNMWQSSSSPRRLELTNKVCQCVCLHSTLHVNVSSHLFIVTKDWKQPQHLSVEPPVSQMMDIHKMECYLGTKHQHIHEHGWNLKQDKQRKPGTKATQIICFHVCEEFMIAKSTDTQSILKISGD